MARDFLWDKNYLQIEDNLIHLPSHSEAQLLCIEQECISATLRDALRFEEGPYTDDFKYLCELTNLKTHPSKPSLHRIHSVPVAKYWKKYMEDETAL